MAQVDDCQKKLARAEKLVSGLRGERERWSNTITSVTESIENVIGDMAMGAGAIVYSAAFVPSYRASLFQQWSTKVKYELLPYSEGETLVSLLQDPVKLRRWQVAGLPMDNLSTENSIIVMKSRRWPLMIDPQNQANNWIRNMEADNGLDKIRAGDADALRVLENGVRFGRPVLMENVQDTLDAALDPLLMKQFVRQGTQFLVKIGDTLVPYHEDFRLYITTLLPNPHYSSEIFMKVCGRVADFVLGPESLV